MGRTLQIGTPPSLVLLPSGQDILASEQSTLVGAADGYDDGAGDDGRSVVGAVEWTILGCDVGADVGADVGDNVGADVGDNVGDNVGVVVAEGRLEGAGLLGIARTGVEDGVEGEEAGFVNEGSLSPFSRERLLKSLCPLLILFSFFSWSFL